MGINQRDPVTVLDIRDHHVLDQGGFPGPGLSYYIYMGSPVLLFDAKQLADIPIIGDSEKGDPVRIGVCFVHGFSITAEEDAVKKGGSYF